MKGDIFNLVRGARLVCSAEENGESKEGCDCSRYNEAIDEVLYRLEVYFEKNTHTQKGEI